MSLVTAFNALKAHVESMFAALKSNVPIEEQHLKDLVSHVETVGEHIAQGGRTLVTVDLGNMAVADVKAFFEKAVSEANITATITSIVQEKAATAVEAAVSAPSTTAAQ